MKTAFEEISAKALNIPKDWRVARRLKASTCSISLLALGATFELTSQYVEEMKQEIADWEDGRKVGIGVLPEGPYITIQKQGDRLRYLGTGLIDPDISILFKNLDSAILIFTGMLGAPQAVAENRVCTHGENSMAMQVTRSMAIVQTYLFPSLITSRTFKRPPILTGKQLATKGMIMGLLTPRLLGLAMK